MLAGLTGTVAKATEIQAIQAAGLLDMTEGLASNAKACKDSLNECSESGTYVTYAHAPSHELLNILRLALSKSRDREVAKPSCILCNFAVLYKSLIS